MKTAGIIIILAIIASITTVCWLRSGNGDNPAEPVITEKTVSNQTESGNSVKTPKPPLKTDDELWAEVEKIDILPLFPHLNFLTTLPTHQFI